MDNEAVQGVADAHPSRLGVEDYLFADFQISAEVEVGVNHPGTRFDYRDPGVLADEINQFPASTRDADIYPARCSQHFRSGFVG